LLSFLIHLLFFFFEKNWEICFLSFCLIIFSFFFFSIINFFFFSFFFELSIVPIILLVLGYGYQVEKISAIYYLIFYSFFTFFPFLFFYFFFDYFLVLVYFNFFVSPEFFFILIFGFLIKFPVYFLHFWLPKVHVESPTSGSILLAGLVLKLGVVGIFRSLICISFFCSYIFFIISILGILFCSFFCIFQWDVKCIIAYSSVVHISFLLFSFSCFILFCEFSGFLMSLVHGYVSTILFFLVGEFYGINFRRLIYYFINFFCRNIFFCLFFSIFFFLNSGFPISLSFFSEFFGISIFFLFYSYLFFFFVFYFLLTFYYSVYILISIFSGLNYFFIKIISIYIGCCCLFFSFIFLF
jgi:NADH-ubiquinone oxidoreductase chain 4